MCKEVDVSSSSMEDKKRKSRKSNSTAPPPEPPKPEPPIEKPKEIPNKIILPQHVTGITGDPLNILGRSEFVDLELSDMDRR